MSNVGRLAVNGDGGMILASCYTLGIQRFDLRGATKGPITWAEPSRTPSPTFPGRTIAAATLEGELAVMNSAGNVRWRTQLPRPVIALEVDPLGRYVIYGHATGEIVRLDLFGGKARAARPASAAQPARRRRRVRLPARTAGSVRSPDWLVPAVETDQQSETAVIAVAR